MTTKNNKIVLISSWLMIVALLILVSVLYKHPPRSIIQHDFTGRAMEPTVSGQYLSSLIARDNGDMAKATEFIRQALKKDPLSPQLLEQTYSLALINGEVADAIKLAQQIPPSKSQTELAAILLMLDDVKKNDFVMARKRLATVPEEGINMLVIPSLKVWLDYGITEGKTPMHAEDAIKRAANFAPFIQYQLALMNDLGGYGADAETYYEKAAKETARMPFRIAESLANFYSRTGKQEKLSDLKKKFMAGNPDDPVAQSIFPDKPDAKPVPVVKNVQEGVSEVLFNTASLIYREDALEETMLYTRLALYLRPDFAPAQILLGNLLEAANRPKEAIKTYLSVNEESPFYPRAQIRAAVAQDSLKKTGDALNTLDALAKNYPTQPEALVSKADILRVHEQYGEAAKAYTEALARIPNPAPAHWKLFYARGICYERAKQWDKAEADFHKALELSPKQPDVLNYLGYSLLVMNKDTLEARKMIETAIAQRPTDAHIIDSMGWSLFVSGDYQGAVDYLERAIELMPGDVTVNDHLGDAYWRVGRQTEAKYQWQRALLFKPEDEEALKIKRKLESGLPPLKEGKKQQAMDDHRPKQGMP